MAVTLTPSEAGVAIRVFASVMDGESASPSIMGLLMRQLDVARELVLDYAPDAPNIIHNEGAIRIVGWLWEAPPVPEGRRQQQPDPLAHSGAKALLSRWRTATSERV